MCLIVCKAEKTDFQNKCVSLPISNQQTDKLTRFMKKYLLLSLVMLMFFQVLTLHAQVYRTGCHTDQIHTLIIHPLNDWKAAPVLQIGSDNQLLISFDEMSHDYKRYAYRIIHCNKDWTRSDLNELEYMDGFPENDIEQYEQSSNTYTMYTHYSITLPNDKVQLKCSGNYALEVFDKEGSGEALLTACFSLFEHKTIVNASLTASTDIDFEQSHQQLFIEVSPIGWTFQQPESEIKLTIRQNCRQDNEINQIEPLSISSNKLVYAHCHVYFGHINTNLFGCCKWIGINSLDFQRTMIVKIQFHDTQISAQWIHQFDTGFSRHYLTVFVIG